MCWPDAAEEPQPEPQPESQPEPEPPPQPQREKSDKPQKPRSDNAIADIAPAPKPLEPEYALVSPGIMVRQRAVPRFSVRNINFPEFDLPTRLPRVRVLRGLILAVVLALGAGLALPVGAIASAVMFGAPPGAEAITIEASLLRGQSVAEAIVARIGATTLASCTGLDTPLAALPVVCSGIGEDAPRDRAVGLVNATVSVSAESGGMLRLSVQAADRRRATEMLAAGLEAEALVRQQISLHGATVDAANRLADVRRQLTELDDTVAETRRIAQVSDGGHELADTVSLRNTVDLRYQAAGAHFSRVQAALETAQAALRITPATTTESDETAFPPAPDDLRPLLMQMRLDRAHMANTYAPGYPGLIELDRKIAETEKAQRNTPARTERAMHVRRNPTFDALSLSVASLSPEADGLAAELHQLGDQRTKVDQRREAVQTAVGRIATLEARRGELRAQAQALTEQVARSQSQTANTHAQLHGIRWMVQSPDLLFNGTWRALAAGLAAFIGFIAGIALPYRKPASSPFYHRAADASAELGLNLLARINLTRNNGTARLSRSLRTAPLILRARSNAAGAPMTTIHVAGTCLDDDAGSVALDLAQAIVATHGKGVLIATLGPPGLDVIESVVPEFCETSGSSGISGSAAVPPLSETDQAPLLLPALLNRQSEIAPALHASLDRLRATHDVLLVVSNGSDHAWDGPVSHRMGWADATLLVVRAGVTRCQAASALHAKLVLASANAPRMIFTKGVRHLAT